MVESLIFFFKDYTGLNHLGKKQMGTKKEFAFPSIFCIFFFFKKYYFT